MAQGHPKGRAGAAGAALGGGHRGGGSGRTGNESESSSCPWNISGSVCSLASAKIELVTIFLSFNLGC